MAGGVFFWEGMMKFVFPHTLGVGRFLKLGIPTPEFMAPFVGVMEIVGGTLFIVGLFTRLAALPLLRVGKGAIPNFRSIHEMRGVPELQA